MVRWTFVLMGICLAVFLLQYTNLFDWELFAFTPSLALERPWTFITSIFLHGGVSHLFFNMFALFMFGLVLESRIGSRNFIILFLLAGIAGSLGYMATASDKTIPAIGASGSIYGVLGALAVIMPFMVVWVFGMAPMPMIAVAFVYALMEFFGLFAPGGIAHGAHLGGLFIGLIFGLYFRKQERKRMMVIRRWM